MIRSLPTSSRRSFLAGAAASIALAKSAGAVTPVSNTEGTGQHYLLTGMSSGGSINLILGVETFDANLNRLGTVEIPDGVINFNPTGRPEINVLMTTFGSAVMNLETSSLADISWETADPGYVFPALPNEGISYNPKYLLAQGMEASNVLLIDLETLEGRDISKFLANEDTSLVALIPDIPEEGSIGGVWTGNNVFLVDFSDPESASRLTGDDTSWYSTTLNLSHDGEWAIFTTYDPATGGKTANVYLQNIASGEYEQILEGHAWTTGFFIPNDPEHFMALSAEGLEYRNLEAPAESGELVANVGQMGVKARWINDGAQLLYGHRETQNGSYSWILIDMDSLDVQELDGLEGMKPYWPRLAHTNPAHLMFMEDDYDIESHSFRGLDLGTGEVWEVLEQPVVPTPLNGLTASADGKWYTISTVNKGDLVGTWLINMETRDIHEFVQGEDKLYSVYAAVSPDGETVAVTLLQQPGSEHSTWTAPTNAPDDLTKLTDSVVIGWT